MTVGYKVVRETFTSRVRSTAPRSNSWSHISTDPFSQLKTAGLSAEAGDGACGVEFFIAYEFRSRTLATLMGAMFDAAFRKFTSAFEARADQIFGL